MVTRVVSVMLAETHKPGQRKTERDEEDSRLR